MRLRQLIIQNLVWRGLYFLSLFLLNVFVSRFFRAEASGSLYYIVNNLSLLLLLLGLSLESAATFYVAKNEIKPGQMALLCVLWTLLATLLSLVCQQWMGQPAEGLFASRQEYTLACGCYIAGVLLTTYFNALFMARQEYLVPNLILFLVNLFMLLIIVLAHSMPGHPHLVFFYLASFLLQGILVTGAYLLSMASTIRLGLPGLRECRKIGRYSLVALGANLVFFLVYRIDYWLVSKFCSPAQLGNYIQVSKLGQILLLLPAIFAANIFPRAASGKGEEIHLAIRRIIQMLFLTGLVACLVLSLTGWWLFPFLYGSSFSLMPTCFILLVPGILALTMVRILAAYFAGINKVRYNLTGAAISLVLIVIVDFIFIPRYGINAAAATSSLGYISYLAFLLFSYRRHFSFRLIDFWAWQDIRKGNIVQMLKKELTGNTFPEP